MNILEKIVAVPITLNVNVVLQPKVYHHAANNAFQFFNDFFINALMNIEHIFNTLLNLN